MNWRHLSARPVDRWFFSADLGQSKDPTALCGLHHVVTPLEQWTIDEKARLRRQKRVERFNVRFLERLPLGMSYPAQILRISDTLRHSPFDKATFVLDDTGVGRAVGDLAEEAGLRPYRVTITAGSEPTQHGARGWHVPKSILISTLDARSHSGELNISPKLADAEVLRAEMQDFRRKTSEAGRTTYNAREGAHDDLVLSVAIALWMATSAPRTEVSELVV